MAGDFNINLLHVDTYNNVSNFIDIIYSQSLFPSIHKPTRITSKTATLIDNIFVSCSDINTSGLLITDISDHLPIFCFSKVHKRVDIINTNSVHNKINYHKTCDHLLTINWDFITN